MKALQAHESQMRNMGLDAEGRLREYASMTGKRAGLAHAEAFRTFRLRGER